MSLNRSNVKTLLKEITGILKAAGSEEAELDASLILMKWLGFSKTQLYSRDDDVPAANQMRKIDYWVKKCKEGCPIQYLLGR
ncbi:MAG: hypothetical protein LIO44_04865, partial [Eubacterium sp.]|nr:hypothetical protein [Eubacterium sp.]